MLLSKVSRRYAEALHAAACEANGADAVLADLAEIAGLIRESPALRAFLGDYSRPREYRRRVLESLFQERTDPLTWKLLRFVESKKRLGFLAEIIQALRAIHDTTRGVMKVRLTSAFPVDAGTATDISERIRRQFGKPVEMDTAVDPRLLGGFCFRIDDTVYDYSVQGSLRALQAKLTRSW